MPKPATVDAPPPSRADLSAALAALRRAQDQLAELERGQERAREKSWACASQVEEAQAHLAKLKVDEQRRLASSWVDDDTVVASPLPAAEHALAQAREERDRIQRVEDALAAEIPHAQSRLREAQRDFQAELSEFVTELPQYSSLCTMHKLAWTRLRSVRAALATIHSALGDAVPIALLEAGQRGESLSINVGASVDHDLVDSWARAMEKLASDPDHAELPS